MKLKIFGTDHSHCHLGGAPALAKNPTLTPPLQLLQPIPDWIHSRTPSWPERTIQNEALNDSVCYKIQWLFHKELLKTSTGPQRIQIYLSSTAQSICRQNEIQYLKYWWNKFYLQAFNWELGSVHLPFLLLCFRSSSLIFLSAPCQTRD